MDFVCFLSILIVCPIHLWFDFHVVSKFEQFFCSSTCGFLCLCAVFAASSSAKVPHPYFGCLVVHLTEFCVFLDSLPPCHFALHLGNPLNSNMSLFYKSSAFAVTLCVSPSTGKSLIGIIYVTRKCFDCRLDSIWRPGDLTYHWLIIPLLIKTLRLNII